MKRGPGARLPENVFDRALVPKKTPFLRTEIDPLYMKKLVNESPGGTRFLSIRGVRVNI